MKWITRTLSSSVGKKPIMAISGFSLCIFLLIHLSGNLTIYFGKEIFNTYCEHLHSLNIFINIIEICLLSIAIIHISTAINLFYKNQIARSISYKIKKNAGGRSIGSSTMPYTGLFLLIFIWIHLSDFHFTDKSGTSTFSIVSNSFSSIGYAFFYVFSSIVVAIHVSHGFWSTFQTIGINHIKYTKILKITSSTFALILGVGFGFIPIYLSCK